MTGTAGTLLIQWWTPIADGGEFVGQWFECADAFELKRRIPEIAMDRPWLDAVLIVVAVDGNRPVELATDLGALARWDPSAAALPEPVSDIDLPPRGRRELRYEVVLGCRDHLARGVRARMLAREDVGTLLLAIDRAFDQPPVQAAA